MMVAKEEAEVAREKEAKEASTYRHVHYRQVRKEEEAEEA